MPVPPAASLDLATLAARYRAGASPVDVMTEVYARIAAHADPAVWIHLRPQATVLAEAHALAARGSAGLPLFGVPFAIKDNLDLAGVPTTAGCPDFANVPGESAEVVARLLAAGAIPIGKTNLDQFATGLVGTRSPYGTARNPFDARYIPGGSSSGSGAAVSAGLVSFALGTDTAGSGRVPAAFTNIVGLKPTKGLLSTRGLVPAVRSLDCVSIFALTCADAWAVQEVAAGFDARDPFSRRAPAAAAAAATPLRVGVPAASELRFFGNRAAEERYRAGLGRLAELGATLVEIDYQPFRETAELLYGGPWVAERYAAVGDFLERRPEAGHPVTRRIIAAAKEIRAVAAFRGLYRLADLRRAADAQWERMDVLALPTTGSIFTIAEVAAEPLARNTDLGYYTNFANLLDLCAMAVPNGFQADGLPTGMTFFAAAWQDALVADLAARFHAVPGTTMGAGGAPLPEPAASGAPVAPVPPRIRVAVVGAHLQGQPLHHQLAGNHARFVRAARTAAVYRLHALPGPPPPRPGLVRVATANGAAIAVEVWSLDTAGLGALVAEVPAPLAIGSVELEDGEVVKGFLCEAWAAAGGEDITRFGGWRAYLQARAAGPGAHA